MGAEALPGYFISPDRDSGRVRGVREDKQNPTKLSLGPAVPPRRHLAPRALGNWCRAGEPAGNSTRSSFVAGFALQGVLSISYFSAFAVV